MGQITRSRGKSAHELQRYVDSTNRVEKMRQPEKHNCNIDEARSEWLKARELAAELAKQTFSTWIWLR